MAQKKHTEIGVLFVSGNLIPAGNLFPAKDRLAMPGLLVSLLHNVPIMGG